MTPFGHAAIGLVVGRAHARLVPWLVALGGVLPDVDFALVWAPQFNAWHRVVTHNLAFVVVASLLVGWAIARSRRISVPLTVLAIAIGGVLHLLVDACMDGNSSNGIGVAILWPFDDRMWSPFNVLGAATSGPGWRDPGRALLGSARGLVWELPWIAAAVLLHVRERRRRPL
jgi:membrane-bound metal-dependent hydrolase YbcI (DUF457 family)